MKLLRNISLPLIASLALFACERDYDAPLLTEPEYTGPAANITISELRRCTRRWLSQRENRYLSDCRGRRALPNSPAWLPQ